MEICLKISKDINEKYNKILGLDDEDVYIPIYESKKFKKDTLIMSGGGISGISFIGSLKALEIKNILKDITTFAGTSMGALILSLYVIGYAPDKILQIIQLLNFEKLGSLTITNLINHYGLDTGKNIEYLLKKLIIGRGYKEDITLKELFDSTNKKLIITTVCLNTMEVCYISHETHPNISLHKAIRMSISIPIFFTPVEHDGDLYIDGGCIDNYPIHIFKDRVDNVIGVFISGDSGISRQIDNIETYIVQIIKCINFGFAFQTFKGYENNTVMINIENIGFMNFNINKEDKEYMFNEGFFETIKFLNKIKVE